MKKEVSKFLYGKTKSFRRPVLFTIHYSDYLSKFEHASDKNKHLFNELHRRVYKKSQKKIPRIVVIEKSSRLHSHMIIETPEHVSPERFDALLSNSHRSVNGTQCHIEQNIYNTKRLCDYLSKQSIDDLNLDLRNIYLIS